MSFYGYARNSGIPRLLNYAQAKAHFDTVEPIKTIKYKDGTTNNNAGIKPLGLRNKTWFKIQEGKGGCIECIIWNKDVAVRYHKNGDIELINPMYNSNSTVNFIADLLGSGFWSGIATYIHDFGLQVRVREGWGENGGEEVSYHKVMPTETLTLRLAQECNSVTDNRAVWEVANPKPILTHTINREAYKEIKGQYTELRDYIRQYLKLLGGEFEVGEAERDNAVPECMKYLRLHNQWVSGVTDFAESISILSKWVGGQRLTKDKRTREERLVDFNKTLMVLVRDVGNYDWSRRVWKAKEHQLSKALDSLLLGIWRDVVLDAKVDETGTRRDRYGFLYRRGWKEYHSR